MDGQEQQPTGAMVAPDGDEVVIEFASGLPGFPDARRFAVRDLGPDLAPFAQLHSLETPEVIFTVVPPGVVFPDYRVEVDDEHAARLGLHAAGDAAVLCIVTPAPPPAAPVVNLLGPIVVNRTTRAAAQVVQHRSGYGVAVPLAVPAGGEPAPSSGG